MRNEAQPDQLIRDPQNRWINGPSGIANSCVQWFPIRVRPDHDDMTTLADDPFAFADELVLGVPWKWCAVHGDHDVERVVFEAREILSNAVTKLDVRQAERRGAFDREPAHLRHRLDADHAA